jgi:long-chain acyl-CoA synthetase
MSLIDTLSSIWRDSNTPFLIHNESTLSFSDLAASDEIDLSFVKQGDVVALIGDLNPISIWTLLRLIDLGAIIVPLTKDTNSQHEYFFESAYVDVVISAGTAIRRNNDKSHVLIDSIRSSKHAGLILFSTGTTGRPKAILHNFSLFLKRYATPRPTFKTINFLLFDHIGGINTLLHTLFNKGTVVTPSDRNVDSVLNLCSKFGVEVLPTTPTFLRLMLMSGAIPNKVPRCLKVITYGTERMDQPTLDDLCRLLPSVDFRQTFGMSELGIVRVKSENRSSLYMNIGGEGVETKVVDGILHMRSTSRMLGYLNAESPFDDDGWYNTKDIVELKDGLFKITGRLNDVINVGGLKFMPSEVERIALAFPNVSLVKAVGQSNPITGQHVELAVQPNTGTTVDKNDLVAYMKSRLPVHMVPKRVLIQTIGVGHRFKKV